MSYVPGSKSEDPIIHFEAGMEDFVRMDKVRFINIIGSIQYGILYSIIYLIMGIFLNVIFPKLVKGNLLHVFGWIILQCIAIILITFYVQKFVKAIPGLASFFPTYFDINILHAKGFIPYGISEYSGDIASSLILIVTQINLLEKISYFTFEFSKYF